MMKTVFVLAVVFCAVASPVFAALTPEDLDKIRLIVKDEVKSEVKAQLEPVKADIAELKADVADLKKDMVSVREDVAGLNGKVEGIEKTITWLLTWLMFVVGLVGLPQVIIAWLGRKDRTQNQQMQEQGQRIEALVQEIEALKQQVAGL